MKIIWSQFAEQELDNIFDYYSENSNKTIATKLVTDIINEPNLLLSNPHLGPLDQLKKN